LLILLSSRPVLSERVARLDDVEQAMRELAERARLVVVKRGPQGSMALQDGQIVYSPGLLVNAVDTTGAGDSFAAGLIFAHVIQGQALPEALRFADACGALSTTGYGGTAGKPTLRRVLVLLSLRAALHGSRPCPISSL